MKDKQSYNEIADEFQKDKQKIRQQISELESQERLLFHFMLERLRQLQEDAIADPNL